MTYINGVGPQVGQQKLPVNQSLAGNIAVPPLPNPQKEPKVPNTPLAGLISPPKLPPSGPYIPAPIAGLINPPKLPKGPITQPPLAGLIAPPVRPQTKPQITAEEALDAIKDLIDVVKNQAA